LKDEIKKVFKEIVIYGIEQGIIEGKDVFVDHTKNEANSNKHKVVWRKQVENQLKKIDDEIDELFKHIDKLNEEEGKIFGSKDLPEQEREGFDDGKVQNIINKINDNINFQLNVLGIASLSDLGIVSNAAKNNSAQNKAGSPRDEAGLPSIVNGQQILKMDASSRGYSPNYFKVRVGIPVRWEITDKGTSGCTNAVISKSLFEGEIPLTPGQTSVKEFTPKKAGKYKFSCWMGMISGIIEVVDEDGSATQNNISDPSVELAGSNGSLFTPSGAEELGGSCGINGGCGCGGNW